MAVALAAARADGTRMPHALLAGAPGLGKTLFAHVIANEVGSPLHLRYGQQLRTLDNLRELFEPVGDRHVVFVDEGHDLPAQIQEALYEVLDSRCLGGRGRPGAMRVADFTLMVATTAEGRLQKPLRDRIRLKLEFEFYSPHELACLLRRRVQAAGMAVEDGVPDQIAARSMGVPRLALNLLARCHEFCRSEGQDRITVAHLTGACRLARIDSLGLGPNSRQYLAAIAAGTCTLHPIAHRLGRDVRWVATVLEPDLIRLGLVRIGDHSRRHLTELGHRHVTPGPPAAGGAADPLADRKARVLQLVGSCPEGATRNLVRQRLGTGRPLHQAIAELVRDGLLEECEVLSGGGRGRRPYPGYRCPGSAG